MTDPSDADALRILSDQLEERGDDAGARLLRDVADRLEWRTGYNDAVDRACRMAIPILAAKGVPGMPSGRTGTVLGKSEAIQLAYQAIRLFGHTYPWAHERLGALIEAMGLFCEELKTEVPDLWMDACRHAARLTDERRKDDPEYQAELARLRNSVRPWTVDGEGPRPPFLG